MNNFYIISNKIKYIYKKKCYQNNNSKNIFSSTTKTFLFFLNEKVNHNKCFMI